ncbi:MAG: hypothetical protein FWF05_08260 [Oscillospiraceae bacterium]|nr:hypothetical protein [Oscillospiraceae bacterium]
MHKEVKAAIITGFCTLLVGVIGGSAVTNYFISNNNENNNQNNNSQSISLIINGAEVQVRPDELQATLDSLQGQINQLRAENESLTANAKTQPTTTRPTTPDPPDPNEISIFSLNPVNKGSWDPNKGALEDSLGNTYSTVPYIAISDRSGWAEYYTQGKYSRIKGKVAPHKDLRQDLVVQLKIYADDLLKYSSVEIARKTLPFDFDVEIKDAQFIKIEVIEIQFAYGFPSPAVLIMDMVLVK